MGSKHTSLSIVLLSLGLPLFLMCQWSNDPSENLQIGNGYNTQTVSDGEGGAFVIWTTDDHIHTQKLDRFGFTQWNDELSGGGVDVCGSVWDTCYVIIEEDYTLIASDNSGGAYVMYSTVCYLDSPLWGVVTTYIQHIDSAGNRLWGPSGVEPMINPVYETRSLGIVNDGNGGIFVVYHHYESGAGVNETYVQHLDYEGNFLWGDSGIYLTSTSQLGKPSSDGQGGLLIGWSDIVHRFNFNGDRVWGEEGVNVPTGIGYMETDSSSVIYITGGEYLGNMEKTFSIQKLSYTDGSLLWDSAGVVIDTIDVGRIISGFDYIPNSGIALTWFEEIEDNFWNVFVQWVTPEGAALYPQGGIPASIFPSSKHSSIIIASPGDENGIIVIWEDLRSPYGFYSQKLNNNGDRLWGFEDITVTTREAVPSNYSVTKDNMGGAIISWHEDSGFNISIQQISTNGVLGEVLLGTDQHDMENNPKQFRLNQNYPNPFNSITTITYFIEKQDHINLSVLNVNGQLVKELDSGYRKAGYYTFILNTNALSSGVYFYRLESGGKTQTKKLLYLK